MQVGAIPNTRIVRVHMAGGIAQLSVPAIVAGVAACELNSENVDEPGLAQIFRGSGEGALQMVPGSCPLGHGVT